MGIETLDDIEFSGDGSPHEVLQLKHHSGTTSLTDSSVDWWRTLKNWIAIEKHDPPDVYFLVTTAQAPDGSAAHLLAPTSRSPQQALKKLLHISTASESRENAGAYTAFKELDPDQRSKLLGRVYVLANEADVVDLAAMIRGELVFATSAPLLGSLIERVEGWWFARCVQHLKDAAMPRITGTELSAKIHDVQDQLRSDNLPIDDDILGLFPSVEDHADRTFVRQLDLINIAGRRIALAIQDYVRAFAQRSKWVREELLPAEELGRYEMRLVDEWERHFEEMKERLGGDVTEAAKVDAAKQLYRWVEQDAQFPIRRRCDEPFVTRGSFHILSDESRVGWHLDFGARLMILLEAQT